MADNAFLELDRVRKSGRKAVLATVVRAEGPSYRRPGASAVIAEDGEVIGAISAGCLDADIRENALQVIAGGAPRLLHYNTGSTDDLLFGTGSGCGGMVTVLVAAVSDDLLQDLVPQLVSGAPVVLDTVVEPGPSLGQRRLGPTEDASVFRQVIQPPVTLLVCGAGEDARPLAQYAAAAGFRVVVCDHRPAWASLERFPTASQALICDCATLPTQLSLPAGSYAVLLTHQFERDLAHLEALLDRPLAYIGLLGARDRSARLLRELLNTRPDLYQTVREKVHAPVGLDIGADGPAEIALSIAAELVAHRAGRPGTPLSAVRPT
ncbi:MAG TPA: XdhC/CoxI family protein [Symbiobacteriaceae bacterium]|nr:XdhC/CoxI family protein [Symbiobacteriaceae bacterium]